MSKNTPPKSESTQAHREAAGQRSAHCCVLTVSDTRTLDTDKGGSAIVTRLEAAGHTIYDRQIVPDEPEQIEALVRRWLADPQAQLIITTGGTGIARRDTTVEIIDRLLDKKLDGFGELFRMLSWEEVGPASMLSRALGGLAGEAWVFALPGSLNAVGLAMDKLILPELSHLLWERSRF